MRNLKNAEILEYCHSEGFDLVGIVKPGKVKSFPDFVKWLDEGNQADMHWLENNLEKRADTRLIMEGVKSIIVVGVSYFNSDYPEVEGPAKIARYAWGNDYHIVIKNKLIELGKWLGDRYGKEHDFRAYVDTGPILERELAKAAGLGFIGKNRLLINHQLGSYFFIGSLFTTLPLDEHIEKIIGGCGDCRRCLEACPTGALVDGKKLDARKCISYHTIENRGKIPEAIKKKMGERIFGCDTCQEVCPWNRFARNTRITELKPQQERDKLSLDFLKTMSVTDYQQKFKKSAVKRAKFEGLKRNIS